MFRCAAIRHSALVGLITFGICLPATGDSISLAWDAVTHPQLSGYRIYYGPSAGNYTSTFDAGLTTQVDLTGLTSCTDYHVSIKALASDGSESNLFSDEVVGWARPIVSSASPATLEQSTTQDLVVSGANFRSGLTVSVSNPGVTVNTVTVQGCNQLTVNLTAASSAATGAFDLQVTDTGGSNGSATAIASVSADATSPTISALQAGTIGSTNATISWDTGELAGGAVFFRSVGETVYQVGPTDSALALSHSFGLTGLSPTTTYEYYVESQDGSGNLATANGPLDFTTLGNANTYLRFEAEQGPLSAPAEAVAGAGAFANGWMQLAQGTAAGTPGSPAGSWDFGFTVPSGGTWYVWLRMYGQNGNSNSWFESVDGAALSAVEPAQNNTWEWVAARSWALTAGQHTLTLGGAEERARVDRVLITDDATFVPTEQPGSDTVPPSAALGLTATEDDSQVVLDWTNPSDADLDRIVIRYRDDGITPVSPWDGQPFVDRSASAAAADSATHGGLTNGVTLTYGLFAIDASGNASSVAAIQATPQVQQQPPAQVQNLRRTDNQ